MRHAPRLRTAWFAMIARDDLDQTIGQNLHIADLGVDRTWSHSVLYHSLFELASPQQFGVICARCRLYGNPDCARRTGHQACLAVTNHFSIKSMRLRHRQAHTSVTIDIWNGITGAGVIVADLSGANPNTRSARSSRISIPASGAASDRASNASARSC